MSLRPILARFAALAILAGLGVAAPAEAAEALPAELEGVTVVERLGEQVDPDLSFVDHTGATVRMADLLEGDIPVLLTLNYYTCETLCSFQLNALLAGLDGLDWTAGDRFRIVTVSIDPKETAELAAAKRDAYLAEYGRGDVDWQFLVGEADQVGIAVGFGFKYDARTGQYAHPAVRPSSAPTARCHGTSTAPPTRPETFALPSWRRLRAGSAVLLTS